MKISPSLSTCDDALTSYLSTGQTPRSPSQESHCNLMRTWCLGLPAVQTDRCSVETGCPATRRRTRPGEAAAAAGNGERRWEETQPWRGPDDNPAAVTRSNPAEAATRTCPLGEVTCCPASPSKAPVSLVACTATSAGSRTHCGTPSSCWSSRSGASWRRSCLGCGSP